jgi:hypothetical protein
MHSDCAWCTVTAHHKWNSSVLHVNWHQLSDFSLQCFGQAAWTGWKEMENLHALGFVFR